MQEEFNQANIKLTSSQTKHESLLSDIANIEARLKSLNDELSNKKAVVKAARDEVDEMTQRIQYLEEKKAGLCIRFSFFYIFIFVLFCNIIFLSLDA